ncbi:TMEM143 family protein [Anatilimnocola sp. NA78]|uniref:TMEM143 family protein n=1 Tax=Anatilimnocola sp. NA78 TaxID=3415683 RepID=UPI003CE52702
MTSEPNQPASAPAGLPPQAKRRAPSSVARELPHDRGARPLEHFIPIRKADLVRLLQNDSALELHEREPFAHFCKLVEATLHHDFHKHLEELKDAYAPFDPDAEPKPREVLTVEQREGLAVRLFDRFDDLLQRANFRRLSADELQYSLQTHNESGVEVLANLEIFERLEIYVRGDVIGKKTIRNWAKFGRWQETEICTYQRLALMFRLKKGAAPNQPLDPSAVVLKLFKNIPKSDIEMLLPGTQVRMSLLDKGKIWLPTLSGVGFTAFKLVQGAAAVAFASLQGTLAFLALLSGVFGYGLRSFYGYLNTRDRYHLNLTRSLYFQNLDSNAGVMHRLLDEAEEQEFREIILAWWLLRQSGFAAVSSEQLDRSAEAWLHQKLGLHVDFEVSDALGKLQRMGLCREMPGHKYRAVDLESALVTLDRAWDQQFEFNRQPASTIPLRRAA